MPGRLNERSYVLIGAALALPIVVLVVIQLVFGFNRERENVERQALSQAAQITELAEASMAGDVRFLEALTTADQFERHEWANAFSRSREIAALNPHWRNVIISDLATNEEVFDLSHPYSAQRRPINRAIDPELEIQGAVREGPGCPCVYLNRPIGAGGRYLITVAVDPAVFQSILERHAPPNSVAAIVDRNGNFVGRTVDFAERVGTPATDFVQAAIRSGENSGLYTGTTYEGFRNHTAYVISPTSGWSTHIAVASNLIDGPRTYSYISIVVGALLALAAAAGLIAWALRDLSERRQAEARMAQTQKLEAIGQLTGGVAHDFNNLLTVVIGGLNMLLRRLEDPKQREIAEHMLDAAKRGDRLTKQLLAFSRGKRMELAPVNLNELVPGMEELLRRSIDPSTTLEFALDPDACWVTTDANQLELAILNLVINARDAMPEGGRIEIATRLSRRDEFIELSVNDTGMGMPKDVADRAMEPFFTTKPAGKGTGLGLAQVFGAARQSGGSVEIDTAPGRGATVRLLLPRTSAPIVVPAPDEAPPEIDPSAADGRQVLVVDDEPGVRTFMADALREAGYNALEAEDAGAALRLLEKNEPDLLLTDYSMPGMTGLELAERAQAKAKSLRVLIVSGYADADALEASAARPALLRKPFDERTLIEAVRNVLAA